MAKKVQQSSPKEEEFLEIRKENDSLKMEITKQIEINRTLCSELVRLTESYKNEN